MTNVPPIHFEPPPPNDFAEYIQVYFDRCRKYCPKIVGVSGKWSFEDLIPGLSDFDTRFVIADGTNVHEWMEIALAVGKVHEEMVVDTPKWIRNLEHLPGINLMVSELVDPVFYYPESAQWTFYDGPPADMKRIEKFFAEKPWTQRDELFHLKRFASFFGPYQRGIDPAINMGKWESKYPLHSRFIHYFAPPLQSAISILMRKPCRGKLESFRLAQKMFPRADVIDRIFAAIDRHYEIARDYADPFLAELEADLELYLANVYCAMAPSLTVMNPSPTDTPEALRKKTAALPDDPYVSFAAGARFGRLMKGRLLFFAADLPSFDSDFLVRNELGRIVANFYEKPLMAYGTLRWNETLAPEAVLARLRGKLLTPAEADGFTRFAKKANEVIPQGMHRQRSREAADLYDPVMYVHDKLGKDLAELPSTVKQ